MIYHVKIMIHHRECMFIVNKHLMRDLEKLDMWNEDMKQQIIARNGSIQGIEEIPEFVPLWWTRGVPCGVP